MLAGVSALCTATVANAVINLNCTGTVFSTKGGDAPKRALFHDQYAFDPSNRRLCDHESCKTVLFINKRMIVFSCSETSSDRICKNDVNSGLAGPFFRRDRFMIDLDKGEFHRRTSAEVGDFVAVPIEEAFDGACTVVPRSGSPTLHKLAP